jgi:hypothetical protein
MRVNLVDVFCILHGNRRMKTVEICSKRQGRGEKGEQQRG